MGRPPPDALARRSLRRRSRTSATAASSGSSWPCSRRCSGAGPRSSCSSWRATFSRAGRHSASARQSGASGLRIGSPIPAPLVDVPVSDSFPSGHSASSFACAALLAWLTPLPKVPLFALAALIAFSRVYNGVHYPLDVLGGARARPRDRYSSSPARRRPPTIRRQRRNERDPDSDAAAVVREEAVGHGDQADEDEDRRQRAEDDDDEALRDGRRQLDPELPEDDEHDDGEPEQEDELADRARVPPDDRDRRPFVGARVPPHEHREHEHEPRKGASPARPRPRSRRGAGAACRAHAPSRREAAGAQADRARKAPRWSKYLQTERALDLVPDDDAQVDADGDEAEEDEPKAKLGALGLLSIGAVGATPAPDAIGTPVGRRPDRAGGLVDHFRVPSAAGP